MDTTRTVHSRKRAVSDVHGGEHWRSLVYEPLHRASKEIRLLVLLPSSGADTDPECTTFITPTDKVHFAAVSYVWGDASEQLPMYLDGHWIKIGKNAHTALRYIRDVSMTRTIWMDCLCINQRDIQVQRSDHLGLQFSSLLESC